MNVRIRPAVRNDAAFLARIMLLASRSHLERGIWDYMLAAPEDACLAFLGQMALTQTRSFMHLSHFAVAEVDGRPAAALCGYAPEESGQQTLGPACFEAATGLGWGEGEVAGIVWRSPAVLTCASEEPSGAWIVENVATLPEHRRRGLVDALLRHVLDEGRRRGRCLAQVSVLIGNAPAERAYEKAGFRVVDEKRHPDFEAAIGCPGLRRMQRAL